MEKSELLTDRMQEQVHDAVEQHWHKATEEYPSITLGLHDFKVRVLKVLLKSLSQIHEAGNSTAGEQELVHLLSQLRWKELYLTTACAAGNEAAWTIFQAQYGDIILKAALRCAENVNEGHEIADSFLSDLFLPSQMGLTEGEKKIEQYSGMGSLEGWIKVVIARKAIDRIRAHKKQVSIEDLEVEFPSLDLSTQADSSMQDNDQQRALQMVQAGLNEALRRLDPQQKMILQLYYLQDVTLKEIGALLRVHESTAFRMLDRLKTQLLAALSEHLQEKYKVRRKEVRHLICLARSHIELDLKQILSR